jgi:hypothetical protein
MYNIYIEFQDSPYRYYLMGFNEWGQPKLTENKLSAFRYSNEGNTWNILISILKVYYENPWVQYQSHANGVSTSYSIGWDVAEGY